MARSIESHPRWRAASHRGFTLIELILVIVLVGLVAAVIASAMLGRSAGADRRRAVGWLVAELTTARIEAMRTSQPVVAWIESDGDRLALTIGDRRDHRPAKGLWLADEKGQPLTGARVRFQPSGRAEGRSIMLSVRQGEAWEESGGRMGSIEFDPVSGAVQWRPEGQAIAGAVEEVDP